MAIDSWISGDNFIPISHIPFAKSQVPSPLPHAPFSFPTLCLGLRSYVYPADTLCSDCLWLRLFSPLLLFCCTLLWAGQALRVVPIAASSHRRVLSAFKWSSLGGCLVWMGKRAGADSKQQQQENLQQQQLFKVSSSIGRLETALEYCKQGRLQDSPILGGRRSGWWAADVGRRMDGAGNPAKPVANKLPIYSNLEQLHYGLPSHWALA